MEQIEVLDMTSTILGKPYNALLFNDSDHCMDEVAYQIVKAVRCDFAKANAIMLAAHKSGSAVVFSGTLERCELVCSVLEEIHLKTNVEEA